MESKNPIQVADRLFLAMETLSKIGPVSLADLSRELNLNKSTTHRLLSSLIYMGYAKQDSETQKYDLSLKVLALSNCLLERLDILEVVRPYLKHSLKKPERQFILYSSMARKRFISTKKSHVKTLCGWFPKSEAGFRSTVPVLEKQWQPAWKNPRFINYGMPAPTKN